MSDLQRLTDLTANILITFRANNPSLTFTPLVSDQRGLYSSTLVDNGSKNWRGTRSFPNGLANLDDSEIIAQLTETIQGAIDSLAAAMQ